MRRLFYALTLPAIGVLMFISLKGFQNSSTWLFYACFAGWWIIGGYVATSLKESKGKKEDLIYLWAELESLQEFLCESKTFHSLAESYRWLVPHKEVVKDNCVCGDMEERVNIIKARRSFIEFQNTNYPFHFDDPMMDVEDSIDEMRDREFIKAEVIPPFRKLLAIEEQKVKESKKVKEQFPYFSVLGKADLAWLRQMKRLWDLQAYLAWKYPSMRSHIKDGDGIRLLDEMQPILKRCGFQKDPSANLS